MPHPVLTRAASSSNGGTYFHPAGALVAVITAATDDEQGGYVSVSYDIAEGEYAGHYEYSNEFRRYYESRYPGRTQMDKFMDAVEKSNAGFDMMDWQTRWDCSELVGLKVGLVFARKMYTANNGYDREKPQLSYCCAADEVRTGVVKIPDDIDERVGVPASSSQSDNDDLPF